MHERCASAWNIVTALSAAACVILLPRLAHAQVAPPPAPPPLWAGSIGAGLTVTSGNSDVKQYNAGADLQANPNASDTAKFTALLLRGTNEGVLAVNRTSLEGRNEYRFVPHAFVFGQLGYLRDTLKQIDYLVSPLGGVGLEAYKTETTAFVLDAGAGAVSEKDTGTEARTTGALTAGESFTQKLAGGTTLSQTFRGLWKTSNTSDALYTFSAGAAAPLVGKSQLKMDLLDTYKHLPPDPQTKRNDVALVIAIVYKF